ncbi:hypothetical protein AAHE18_10G235600 [Arachis hypogaea]
MCGKVKWVICFACCIKKTEGSKTKYYRTVGDKILPFSKIIVDSLGHGNFSTIQSAIDSVPSNNKYWVSINVKPGIYREKVTIPIDKPYIILKGSEKMRTWVEWDDHNTTAQSPTFQSMADNIVVKSISFRRCNINVIGRALGEGFVGYITAQGRERPKDSNGFVFKNCSISGDGSTFLGRPWRPYARVLFYSTNMTNIIQPAGWDLWNSSQNDLYTQTKKFQSEGETTKRNRRKQNPNFHFLRRAGELLSSLLSSTSPFARLLNSPILSLEFD